MKRDGTSAPLLPPPEPRSTPPGSVAASVTSVSTTGPPSRLAHASSGASLNNHADGAADGRHDSGSPRFDAGSSGRRSSSANGVDGSTLSVRKSVADVRRQGWVYRESTYLDGVVNQRYGAIYPHALVTFRWATRLFAGMPHAVSRSWSYFGAAAVAAERGCRPGASGAPHQAFRTR